MPCHRAALLYLVVLKVVLLTTAYEFGSREGAAQGLQDTPDQSTTLAIEKVTAALDAKLSRKVSALTARVVTLQAQVENLRAAQHVAPVEPVVAPVGPSRHKAAEAASAHATRANSGPTGKVTQPTSKVAVCFSGGLRSWNFVWRNVTRDLERSFSGRPDLFFFVNPDATDQGGVGMNRFDARAQRKGLLGGKAGTLDFYRDAWNGLGSQVKVLKSYNYSDFDAASPSVGVCFKNPNHGALRHYSHHGPQVGMRDARAYQNAA